MIDAVVHDGLWCAFEDVHMGEEAEIVAEKYEISREARTSWPTRATRRRRRRPRLDVSTTR